MKFYKNMIILLVIGVQSGCFDCAEPPRVREYDADVPNIYNGGLQVDQLSAGNEKMAKFIDSSRVELSLDHFTDDSYIQAYKLTHENYQNNEEQLSIDVARENRAHLDKFRVKRHAPESMKFQVSDAKTPDDATLEVMRTKKELRNVRSPYEVVEGPVQKQKSNRIGYRSKSSSPKLYSGVQTHRYGIKNEYNRATKVQPTTYRKADNPEFGTKVWWNPTELSRYKRLQRRGPQLTNPTPAPLILHNGITHQSQPTYLDQQQLQQHQQVQQQQPPQQQPQQHYVTAYIPYQELASVPQAPQLFNQHQYNNFDSQKYDYQLFNQFPQFDKQVQLPQQQEPQYYEVNPYGPVELQYDQAKTQYASPEKLDGLEVLQSLLGRDPKQQLQGLHELLTKEEQMQQQQYQQQQPQPQPQQQLQQQQHQQQQLQQQQYQQQEYQQQEYQQQEYQQQDQQRPQDSTAPIQFQPTAGGQVNQILVTKPPQYAYTVAGSTKQIVPIPTSTTTLAPVPIHTTVAPSTLRYQDLLPSSTPTPFTAVTIQHPLQLLPVPVQHGPESQNALIHSHHISSTPLPLVQSHHSENPLNSLQNHDQQQKVRQNDADSSSEHDDNHDLQYASGYAFGYRVRDFHTGNDFGHTQNRDVDGITRGEYHILLPDGRVQNVRYHADDQGFHADVSYETVH